jgi:hypothetical protein
LTAALPPAAVFCVGAARLVNGVRLGRPVGLLVVALLLSGGITVAVAANAPRRTLAGDRLLERARQGTVPDPRLFGSYGIASYAPAGGDMRVPAAVLGVAVLGAAGVADLDLRQALYGGMSGSGSSDSGGGGCGGGDSGGGGGGCGCGGGGCGG